jgi:ligand-binding sensor domain-containing protein/serine phosphatase RsbU (regulator of sigma subunit)
MYRGSGAPCATGVPAPSRPASRIGVRARSIVAATFAATMAREASALDPSKDISQYVEQSWGAGGSEGLPQNWVDAIAQTHDGYLWLGTQEGLVRFDGVRFTVFSTRTVPALRSNNVSALVVDSEGALWIGTYGGGLTRYFGGQWATWGRKEGLGSDFVISLFEDRERALWVGTRAGGVNRRRGGETSTFTTKDGLANDTVSAIAQDTDGTLWFGTDGGLSRFVGGGFTTVSEANGFARPVVLALHGSREGTLWIGTKGEGLFARRAGAIQAVAAERGLGGATVTAIASDSDGNEWLGTDGAGLYRIHGDEVRASGKKGVRYAVSAFFEDREKNLWVGADNLWLGSGAVGLLRLKDGKVTTFGADEGLRADYAWSVLEDAQGTLWVGTSGGLSMAKGGGAFTQVTVPAARGRPLTDPIVMAMTPLRRGGLWIGTEGRGLGLLEGGSYTNFEDTQGLPNDTIRALHEDAAGDLWIGTYGSGLARLRDGVFSRFGAALGFPDSVVTSFAEGANGTLWIGTERGGLVALKDGRFTVNDALVGDMIESLYWDAGSLWIGTYGAGLALFREGRLYRFTTREGLYDDVLYAIVDDGQGFLWTTSNRGIFRTSKRELLDAADGRRASVTSVSFGTVDGMKSSECNSGAPGGTRTRDGRLWFPTTKGVAMVDPGRLGRNLLAPFVHVEEVSVNRAPVDLAHQRELPPSSKDFAFAYTALSFTTPEKVRFKYRLEGFDRDWIEAGARRVAYYTNLAPGHYRFRVIAANDDGVWNEEGAAVAFDLVPRFYQTAPFFVLVCAGVLVCGAGAVRLRVGQLRARARELEQKVSERTAQLGNALGLLREKDARLNEDLVRAREFQRRILPRLPNDDEVRFSAVYKPADLVGGDVYDVCALGPRRFRALVADTTGHGIQASLRTMVLKTEYDRIKLGAAGPGDALRELNRNVTSTYPNLEMRCSACCFDVERRADGTATLRYASAAHPPLLRLSRRGVEEVQASGTFVGVVVEAPFREIELQLERGDLLVAYTDGLFEQEDTTGAPFGLERIKSVLLATRRRASEATQALEEAFDEFAGGRAMDDDVLLLCVEVAAPPDTELTD